jgi:hypothetical protein
LINSIGQRRRHARFIFFEPVTLLWTGPDGDQCRATASALNLCTYGMAVESPQAIPRQTEVAVEVNAFGFKGQAKVATCHPRGMRFKVGLKFDTAIPFLLDVKRGNRSVA